MSQNYGGPSYGSPGFGGPGYGGVPGGGGGAPSAGGMPPRPEGSVDLFWGKDVLLGDPEALMKVAVFALVQFVPLLGGLVTGGWMSYTLRRTMGGMSTPMPPVTFDFTTLAEYLFQGFRRVVVGLVWAIPGLILFGIANGLFYGTLMGIGLLAGQSESLGQVAGFASICCSIVGLPTLLLLMISVQIIPAMAMVRVDLTGSISAGFAVGEVLSLARNAWKPWLINVLLLGLLMIPLMLLGLIPFVGALLVIFLMQFLAGFVTLSVYRKAVLAGAPSVELGPLEPPVSAG